MKKLDKNERTNILCTGQFIDIPKNMNEKIKIESRAHILTIISNLMYYITLFKSAWESIHHMLAFSTKCVNHLYVQEYMLCRRSVILSIILHSYE